VYAEHSVQSGVDVDGTPVTVEKTVTVEKVNPDKGDKSS
jgi:hypothetical protein